MIEQGLVEPDPLRLAWRSLIKETIYDVVTQPDKEPLSVVQSAVRQQVPEDKRKEVQTLIVEEFGRLHEGVLARNRLRPSQFFA